MKNIVFAAVAMALVAGSANALTLKKGEVISSDGSVAKASETANGQARLAADGVLVSAGVIYIDLNGTTIEVDVADVRGKSKDQIADVIGAAAVEQMQDLYDDAAAHAAEVGGVNAVGKTVEEIVNEALENGAAEGAIVGVSDQMHEQINAAFAEIDGVADILSEEEAAAELGVTVEELRAGNVGG